MNINVSKKRCAKKKEIVLKKIAKQTNNGGNTPDFLPVLAYIADFIAWESNIFEKIQKSVAWEISHPQCLKSKRLRRKP